MHKKLFVLVMLIACVLSIGLVSAQDMVDYEDVDPTGATVVYWHQWGGAQLETIDPLIAEFNETNEWGITVEGVPQGRTGDVVSLVGAGITSGELPNLAAGFQDSIQSWLLDDAVIPLDSLYNSEMWGIDEDGQADLRQDILDLNRAPAFGNQLIAWPIGISANVMSYNTGMLADAGFDELPTTFEDFRAASCAVAEMEGLNGFPLRTSSFDMLSFIVANGGNIFDAEADAWTFDSPEVIDTLSFFQGMIDDGCAYLPEGSAFANTDEFAFGLNPMAVGSSAGIPFINRNIEESGSGVEWVNSTTPWSEGNRSVQLFLTSVGVMNQTPEEEVASWLFLKFLATTDAQSAWTQGTNYLPYTISGNDALPADFFDTLPQLGDLNDLINDPDVNVFSSPAVISQFGIMNEFGNAIGEIINGADVAETMADLQETADELHAESLEDM